jgi:hypothetical protein
MAAQAMVDADLAVWPRWLDVAMSIISPVFAQARSRWAAFDYVCALLRVILSWRGRVRDVDDGA